MPICLLTNMQESAEADWFRDLDDMYRELCTLPAAPSTPTCTHLPSTLHSVIIQILPLSKPVLALVGLFQFMFSRGEYMRPLIYISETEKSTIALGLFRFGSSWRGSTLDRYVWFMAATTAMTVPVLIIFFFVQRTFIEGISLTSLKG
jgi:ABC-type maltose transport system permease subunit